MTFSGLARLSFIGKTASDGVDYTSNMLGGVLILVEVVTHAAVASVFVCLSLSIFCLLPSSCAAPLDVLRALLLLGDCLVS